MKYIDKKRLLPRSNETEVIKKAIETEQKKQTGWGISCGHDFWDKDVDFGETVFCTRCHQYFAKVRVLPWMTKNDYDWGTAYDVNHYDSDWYVPVQPRISINQR
jgi:hypothetical protein